MEKNKLVCPKCGSEKIVKNGKIHNGNHKCRSCGRHGWQLRQSQELVAYRRRGFKAM